MARHAGTLADLQPGRIRQAVVKKALQHPATLYPATLAGLGGVALGLFGLNPVTGLVLAGGALWAGGHFLGQYLWRGPRLAADYLAQVRAQLQSRRHASLAQLQQDLQRLGHADGVQQADRFARKFANFQTILGHKLSEQELTYQRYLTMAEQVYLAGLDNLEQLMLNLQSVSTIEAPALLEELQRLSRQGPAQQTRIQALEQRLSLYHQQRESAEQLLALNEQALTQLDQVTARLAASPLTPRRSDQALEAAMKELTHWVTQVEAYGQRATVPVAPPIPSA